MYKAHDVKVVVLFAAPCLTCYNEYCDSMESKFHFCSSGKCGKSEYCSNNPLSRSQPSLPPFSQEILDIVAYVSWYFLSRQLKK